MKKHIFGLLLLFCGSLSAQQSLQSNGELQTAFCINQRFCTYGTTDYSEW